MTRVTHGRRSCEALLAELMTYLDGDLSARRCAEIERHLTACQCCGDLAANVRLAIDLCRAERRRRLPADVAARARARVAALLEGPTKAATDTDARVRSTRTRRRR
ncbi:MAG: zf-HC2 domain-containing protein [Vicinamibacterales bacterium]